MISNNYFLVTTAIKKTWNSNDPILFLGEWCKKENTASDLDTLKYKIVQYIWDDRSLFYNHYLQIDKEYEILLEMISFKLNSLHNTTHTNRYWRIVIGPWLLFLMQMIYERLAQLNTAIDNFSITGTIILKQSDYDFVPSNCIEFYNDVLTDEWNHFIYSYLIKKTTNIKYSEVEDFKKTNSFITKNTFLNKLSEFYKSVFFKNSKFLINGLGLSFYEKFRLWLNYGYLPFNPPGEYFSTSKVNYEIRNKLIFNRSNINQYQQIVLDLVPKLIPKCYLEDFTDIKSSVNYGFPQRNLNVIITPNIYYHDKFKIWIAEMISKNVKLVLAQHGGGYGIAKFATNEIHEIKIADYFLTWGWSIKSNRNVIPSYMFKSNPFLSLKNFLFKKNKSALLLLAGIQRYSYKLTSEPLSSQWIYYLNDQFDFISKFRNKVSYDLIIKSYSTDYGWGLKKQLNDLYPEIKIIDKFSLFSSNKYKIIISTYNGTSLLETLSCNFPTIIFWDPNYLELRDEAIPFFNLLKDSKIFHESAESAVNHLSNIWKNIEIWWESDKVQIARKHFIENYAKYDNNIPSKLHNILNKINP
jgi:putative transferase (TIGR04331 family)